MTIFADYNNASCLIYGIGNAGRQDDGLGWAFLDWLDEKQLCPEVQLNWHYQLQLEDADLISDKKLVLFVDASKSPSVESFKLETVIPKMNISFTSHALTISSIMAVCQTCFNTVPEEHLLTIRGYEWSLQQRLSVKARQNLAATKCWFNQHLLEKSMESV